MKEIKSVDKDQYFILNTMYIILLMVSQYKMQQFSLTIKVT